MAEGESSKAKVPKAANTEPVNDNKHVATSETKSHQADTARTGKDADSAQALAVKSSEAAVLKSTVSHDSVAMAKVKSDKASEHSLHAEKEAASEVAVQRVKSGAAARSSSWCPENRFPDVNITVEGKGQYDDIIDVFQLQSVLKDETEWTLESSWSLSLIASSMEDKNRSFGFAGGRADGEQKADLFMEFVVPAKTLDKKITVSGTVKTLAENTRFEYRGSDVITRPEAIKFTNICLVPAKCDRYFALNPSMCTDGVWGRLPDPETRAGHSRTACCQELTCEASAPCAPSTKFSERPSYSTAKGSTTEQCCIPKICTADICNSTIWQSKSGEVFGSTEQECCEPRDCSLYQCSSLTKWVKNKSTGAGSTDDECCLPKSCSAYDCTSSDKWTTKESPGDFLGSTFEECCDPLFCQNHTCSPASKWAPNPDAKLLPGSTNPTCCTPTYCRDHTCNASMQQKAGAMVGTKSLQGSTDEECCETKLCKDYTCSDKTRWEHASDQTAMDIDRRGWSDAECCIPIFCAANDCLPESLWQKKNASELEGVQGSLSEQCCQPLFCKDYTCSGDYLDLNIMSTKWYKKKDTNHFKFRGSTDQECCHPRYCSQFFTKFPSKYARLPENLTTARQGNTEAECYQELKCSEYCCVEATKKLKASAAEHLGSTDEECCE